MMLKIFYTLGVGHVRNHEEMGTAPKLKREIGSKLL
jgi:hypothetical protein